jgi:hypothetical protein
LCSCNDEEQRLRLLSTLQRLLTDIEGLIVRTRGRSKVNDELLEALRRTNEQRIALERELWFLEDRTMREILSCASAPPDRGARAFEAAHRLTNRGYARRTTSIQRRPLNDHPEPAASPARQPAKEGGVAIVQALAATTADRIGDKPKP